MKFGVFVLGTSASEDASTAIKAEKSRFDTVWVGDHTVVPWFHVQDQTSELFSSLTSIVNATERVKVIVGVTDPYRRHPSVIAHGIACLDEYSNGRMVLGLGCGEWFNLVPFGIEWSKPVDTVREAISIIKKLWGSTPENPATYKGDIFRLNNAFLMNKPVQKPHPPIYIGSLGGKKTLELTAELGDGWMPWIVSVEEFKDMVNEIRLNAGKFGRRFEDMDITAFTYSAVAEDYESAYEAVEEPSQMALILERKALIKMGLMEDIKARLDLPENFTIQQLLASEDHSRLLQDYSKAVPREAVEKIVTAGTVEDCIKRIEEFADAGAKHIVIVNFGPDVDKTFEYYKNEIIPYFKK